MQEVKRDLLFCYEQHFGLYFAVQLKGSRICLGMNNQ